MAHVSWRLGILQGIALSSWPLTIHSNQPVLVCCSAPFFFISSGFNFQVCVSSIININGGYVFKKIVIFEYTFRYGYFMMYLIQIEWCTNIRTGRRNKPVLVLIRRTYFILSISFSYISLFKNLFTLSFKEHFFHFLYLLGNTWKPPNHLDRWGPRSLEGYLDTHSSV